MRCLRYVIPSICRKNARQEKVDRDIQHQADRGFLAQRMKAEMFECATHRAVTKQLKLVLPF